MGTNTQQKLGKIRPPRVQLTYDVETGGASVVKSLPLVVGVVADLAPGSETSEKKIGDRKFIQISEDSFDSVMSSLSPSLELSVTDYTKPGSEEKLTAVLNFSSLQDFTPAGVAIAVPEIAQLLEARGKLNDLLAKLEGNDKLNDLLSEMISNTDIQARARTEASQRRVSSEE